MHYPTSESYVIPAQKVSEATPMVIPSQYEGSFEPRSIVGIHGAWSPETYYDEYDQVVTTDGHAFFAPRYTIEDPKKNYHHQADEIVEKILAADDLDHSRLDILFHSRSGNLAPLVAARIAVRSITYVNAIIPGTRENFEELVMLDEMFIKHPPPFQNNIITIDRITFIPPSVGGHAFFNDCTPEQRDKFKYLLRPNRVREDDIVLDARPKVPEFAIICDDDQTIKSGWQKARCAITLQRKADVEMPDTGHTPFLSRPKEFAEIHLGLLSRVV